MSRMLRRYLARRRRNRLPEPCPAIVWERATLPQTFAGRLRRLAMTGTGD